MIAEDIEDDDVQIIEPDTSSQTDVVINDVPLADQIENLKEAGNALYCARDFAGALRHYADAIKIVPDSPLAVNCYGNRAACYIQYQEWDKALADLEMVRKLDPTFETANRVNYLDRLLKCLCGKGDFRGARELVSRIKISGEDVHPIIQSAVYRFNENELALNNALAYFNNEHYRDVIFWVTKAEQNKLCPLDFTVKKAESLAILGKFEEAEKVANSVILKDRGNVEAYYVRAYCLYYRDEIQRALDEAQRVLILDPDNDKTKVLYKLAKSLLTASEKANNCFRAQRYEEALGLYKECLKIDPKNKIRCAKLHFNTALTYVKLENYPEAINCCNIAIEIDTNYFKAYVKKAECLTKLRKYNEAVPVLETLVRLNPSADYLNLLRSAKIDLENSKKTNYYDILGVSRNANLKEIKRAYHKMAKKHHPDRHCGASEGQILEEQERFKVLHNAMETLCDPKKRMEHDLTLGQPRTFGETFGPNYQENYFQHFRR